MISAFGVEHGGVKKSMATDLGTIARHEAKGVARKAGYPVKMPSRTSVRMAPSGQSMNAVSTKGRVGTWAFHPSGEVREENLTPEGKHLGSKVQRAPVALTRKGKVAAGSAATAAYVGAVEGADHYDRVKKSAFGVEHEPLDKAFDSEASRHRRQAGAEGAAAGGAVVSGATAGRLGRKSRVTSQASRAEFGEEVAAHHDAQKALLRMAQPTATKGGMSSRKENIGSAARLHRAALGHRTEGMRLAHAAKVTGRASRVSAVTSAGLAATAYGVHRHERGAGRSYGYR